MSLAAPEQNRGSWNPLPQLAGGPRHPRGMTSLVGSLPSIRIVNVAKGGAPQLAECMEQHPAERLGAWRCVIGKQDGRGV